jgi:ATP-binding cassette subfamily F protein uup
MAFLSLQNISLSLGGTALLDGVNLQVERGERVCLLGRNGAGKSTLLRVLTDEIAPDSGEIVFQSGTRVARLPQEVPAEMPGTVYEVVAGGAHHDTKAHELDAIISRLRLEPDMAFAHLSGGLKRRAWLGRTLAAQPDILLLDEPTNHLDIEAIAWLEEFLLRYAPTLLFVTHDRAFLRRLATRIVEIDRGQLLNWECDYDTYLVRKEAALEAEAKQRALFDKRLSEEEAWIRRGVEARRTKAQSRIRALMQMRVERRERRERPGQVKLQMQDVERSGSLVAEAENIGFAYENKPIVRDFSTIIMRGDKIGIIGPNGSGKTTLLRLLLGELEPQEGRVRIGTKLHVAYFDQLRGGLDLEKTVRQNISGENDTIVVNGERRHVIGYLQEFLFEPQRARTPVSVLSGGERNRLLLAKLFTQPANVLVLDEPTNDLDVETLELLENLIVDFKGTLLMVSHDRAFLNNTVTSTIVFEPDASGFSLREYAGGYDDYQRQRSAFSEKPKSPVQSVKTNSKTQSSPSSRPRKLNNREQRELETLPQRIEELEAEQHKLAQQMADPAFYQDGGAATNQATARLSRIESELEETFARWEELLELEKQSAV